MPARTSTPSRKQEKEQLNQRLAEASVDSVLLARITPFRMLRHTGDDDVERKDRPRIGVIGYGSLLQPSELAALSTTAPNRAIPVKIDGLKRAFDQQTSRRTDDDVECAVANAI